jgi:hypothetical protein
MKKLLCATGLAVSSLVPAAAFAHTDVSIGIGIGLPVQAPVYVAAQPVYVPQPVTVTYAPPPSVYYYAPQPVVYASPVVHSPYYCPPHEYHGEHHHHH